MTLASKPGFLLVARREFHWLFHDRVALLLIFGTAKLFANICEHFGQPGLVGDDGFEPPTPSV